MSNIPQELLYSKSHEWVRQDGNGEVTVGITEHAQELLGDLVFIELPETGSTVSAGDECAVVESVKAASDVYAPLSGEVLEVNETLEETPETVNQDAYGDGWMFRVKISDESEFEDLQDAEAYGEMIAEE